MKVMVLSRSFNEFGNPNQGESISRFVIGDKHVLVPVLWGLVNAFVAGLGADEMLTGLILQFDQQHDGTDEHILVRTGGWIKKQPTQHFSNTGGLFDNAILPDIGPEWQQDEEFFDVGELLYCVQ